MRFGNRLRGLPRAAQIARIDGVERARPQRILQRGRLFAPVFR
jgi:hypothetical protein